MSGLFIFGTFLTLFVGVACVVVGLATYLEDPDCWDSKDKNALRLFVALILFCWAWFIIWPAVFVWFVGRPLIKAIR